MNVRAADVHDAPTLASLLADYLAESFPDHAGTPADVLERDVLRGASGLRVLLAEARGGPVGFVAWHRVYDLHWAKGGAEIDDLYVRPSHRGLGAALSLVAAVCSAAAEDGASYLVGASFDPASPVGRFYDRLAVVMPSAQCYCSGRAFRRLAELRDESPRLIVRRLPPKAWNYEA